MESLRRRYNLHKSYRRVKALGDDFAGHNFSESPDDSAKALLRFASAFFAMASQFLPSPRSLGTVAIDKVFGDCSVWLRRCVEFALDESTSNQEATVAALKVTEIILRDARYSRSKQTGELWRRVIVLLDKIESREGKRILLQILAHIGAIGRKEDADAVRQLDGFRKMLSMLTADDEELTRQILKTLRHFLYSTERAELELPEDGAPIGSGSDTGCNSDRNDDIVKKTRTSSMKYLSSMLGELVSEIGYRAYHEIHKMIHTNNNSNGNTGNGNVPGDSSGNNLPRRNSHHIGWPPSKRDFLTALANFDSLDAVHDAELQAKHASTEPKVAG
ncbi:MAG: hypothetical protein MHM6MM_007755, partial [Cercozoa sp. M6MM]